MTKYLKASRIWEKSFFSIVPSYLGNQNNFILKYIFYFWMNFFLLWSFLYWLNFDWNNIFCMSMGEKASIHLNGFNKFWLIVVSLDQQFWYLGIPERCLLKSWSKHPLSQGNSWIALESCSVGWSLSGIIWRSVNQFSHPPPLLQLFLYLCQG